MRREIEDDKLTSLETIVQFSSHRFPEPRCSPGKYDSGWTGNTAAKGNDFVYVCTAANAELPLSESNEKFILSMVSSPDKSSKSSLSGASDAEERNGGIGNCLCWLYRTVVRRVGEA